MNINRFDRAISPTRSAAVILEERERELARRSSDCLGSIAEGSDEARLTIKDAAGRERSAAIPVPVLRLVLDALSEMARGRAVSLIPSDAEITTQDAADILNVSRPYLVGLLEKGDIPFRKVGVQRRVQLRHVTDYKGRLDADRHAALDALARQSQELASATMNDCTHCAMQYCEVLTRHGLTNTAQFLRKDIERL